MARIVYRQVCEYMRCREYCCRGEMLKHYGIERGDYCCSKSEYELHEAHKNLLDVANFPLAHIPSNFSMPTQVEQQTTTNNDESYKTSPIQTNSSGALGWHHYSIASSVTASILLMLVLLVLLYMFVRWRKANRRNERTSGIVVHHTVHHDTGGQNVYQNMDNVRMQAVQGATGTSNSIPFSNLTHVNEKQQSDIQVTTSHSQQFEPPVQLPTYEELFTNEELDSNSGDNKPLEK
uniref:uncharacterized protein LOC104265881 isoform X1 n=1 Tax=Ciona intestinalis TaxID=7719 RepID=UPI00052158FA|nr:uncharacterized protein LOC104265881 isoform X1 [Ciona intestinalis]|eukprot:XP_009859232.1 uncharacterized protein LOC104265881 isoform X1 [Ciona intestinalis]